MEKRSWEELLSDGLIAREGGDKSNWLIGDLAIQVVEAYGKDSLEAFAKDVIVPKAKVKRYMEVSKAFPAETRHAFLSFEHHNEVYKREDRHDLLNRAEDDSMTIENFRMMLKNMKDSVPEDKRTGSMVFNELEFQTLIKWAFNYPERTHVDEVLLERIKEKYDRVTLNSPKTEGTIEAK